MTTQTLIKKLHQEVTLMRRDIRFMRGVFDALGDPEGDYKAGFVRKIHTRQEAQASFRFTTPAAFLKHARAQRT